MTFADNNISIVLDISNLPMLPLLFQYIHISSVITIFLLHACYSIVLFRHNFLKLIIPS